MLEALFVLIAMFFGFKLVESLHSHGYASWLVVFGVIISIVIIAILPGIYAMITGAPFVLTTKKRLGAMMKLGVFKKTDIVYDLGCGDGRIIREIAKRGVKKAIGYELSIFTCFLAKLRVFFGGGSEKIYLKNFWKQNYRDADVIVCFLLSEPMKRIRREIWPQLKRGAKFISNDARLPGLKADKELYKVYLYIKK